MAEQKPAAPAAVAPQAAPTPLAGPTVVGRARFRDLRLTTGLIQHAGTTGKFAVTPAQFSLADFSATPWNTRFNVMSDGTFVPIPLGTWMY